MRKEKAMRLMHLITRDGCQCHYCGIPLVNELTGEGIEYKDTFIPTVGIENSAVAQRGYSWLYIDHKTPKALGGTGELDNLVLSCRECNQKKLVTPYAEYIKSLVKE